MYATLMMLWLTLADPVGGKAPPRRRPAFRRSPQRPPRRRPVLEQLESRCVLSSGLKLGPLVQITGLSPLSGQPGVEAEPYFAVNPANPKNMVGTWTQDTFPGSSSGPKGIGVAVTFNGGHTWQTSFIPGLTLATGGSDHGAFDSWLSFAPNGDLYFTAGTVNPDVLPNGSVVHNPTAILVEKSTDGGLTWSAPITLIQSTDPQVFNDKDSITADPTPTAAGYAYAVWDQLTTNSGKGPVMFTRTTDGGQSWDTPRTIYDAGNNQAEGGNQILVLPNSSLTDFFDDFPFNSGNHSGTLSLIQSSDRGQTWSTKATPVASMLTIGVTDPDTGQGVNAAGAPRSLLFDVAEDPNSGNLYAVWQDARFSNFQHDSIGFSMSADGGVTWSTPIQINQTPKNIPAGDQQTFLPSVAVAADGSVAVTYYDFRFNDANPGLLTDYWLVEARAGTDLTNPASWHNEARLTNASFDLEKAAIWTGAGYWIGDYQGLAAAGNSFDAFFSATNGSDPGDIYFRDPVAAANTPVPVLMSEATAAIHSGAPLASAASWAGPAVDALFVELTRTSQTIGSVANGDTAPGRTFDPAPPSLPGTTEQVVPPPARVSGTLTAALPWRATNEPADDWGADVLTSPDPSWDGGADTLTAG